MESHKHTVGHFQHLQLIRKQQVLLKDDYASSLQSLYLCGAETIPSNCPYLENKDPPMMKLCMVSWKRNQHKFPSIFPAQVSKDRIVFGVRHNWIVPQSQFKAVTVKVTLENTEIRSFRKFENSD